MYDLIILPVIFIIIFIGLLSWTGITFFWAIIEVILNALAWYVIYYRTRIDIKLRYAEYITAGVVSIFIILLVGNFLKPLWLITSFALLSFLFAKLFIYIRREGGFHDN